MPRGETATRLMDNSYLPSYALGKSIRVSWAAAKEHLPESYPLFLCAFRAGMRLGELLGLAWTDVDFAANRITVQRSHTHGRFSTPKSHKSRVVDLSDQLGATLLEHQEALRQRFGGSQPSFEVPGPRGNSRMVQFVFPSETGGPLCGDNFRRRCSTG